MLLIISDLHLDEDPEGRINWLSRLIEEHRPEIVISLGDLGVSFDYGLFVKEVLSKVVFRGIYGNHDDVAWLQNQYNFDGSRVQIEDGEVVEAEGLKLGFVNGVISRRRRSRKGVPRKRPEEFLEAARKLRGIDVLCIHEFPAPDELLDSEILHAPAFTAREAVRIVRPKLTLCGHIHYYRVEPKLFHVSGTKLLVIDSSEGAYATLENGKVKLMRTGEDIFAVEL